MRILDLLLVILASVATIVWSVACCALASIVFLLSTRHGMRVHLTWGKGLLWLWQIDLTVRGLENLPDRGVLAPNHQSMFDMFVIACLPVHYRWISKRGIGFIPVVGWAMWSMGCFFVKRDGSVSDLAVMKKVEQTLRRGAMVVIFPEGTRSKTSALLPFKKGAFRTAINAQVPLIPIAISGTRDIAPPGSLPMKLGHPVTMTIGQPLFPPPDVPMEKLMALYRERMELLLAENNRLMKL